MKNLLTYLKLLMQIPGSLNVFSRKTHFAHNSENEENIHEFIQN